MVLVVWYFHCFWKYGTETQNAEFYINVCHTFGPQYYILICSPYWELFEGESSWAFTMIGTWASVWSNVYFYFCFGHHVDIVGPCMLQRHISLLIGVHVANSISCLVYLLLFYYPDDKSTLAKFPRNEGFQRFQVCFNFLWRKVNWWSAVTPWWSCV